jgi:SAM-dependent methyltransferase
LPPQGFAPGGGPGPRAPAAAQRAASDASWKELHRRACAPYRPVGRFAWHFARGKLGRDPVFRHLVERGELPPGSHVVDLGCGQGLMAALLAAAANLHQEGRWPAAWGPAPLAMRYTGVDLMQRDIERARIAHAALAGTGGLAQPPAVSVGDMCRFALPACDVVVMMDVMHYVDHAAQQDLLQRIRTSLSPQGRLLMRIGDSSSTRGFAVSQWVDRVVTAVRGHRIPPTWGRPLSEWVALLESLGFMVDARPMSQGTPFANVLLVAQHRDAKAA